MNAPDFSRKIVTIYDRIAHPSTTEIDTLQCAEALRRMLKGRMPSHLLQDRDAAHGSGGRKPATAQIVRTLHGMIAGLEEQMAALQAENKALARERTTLEMEVELLKDKYDEDIGAPIFAGRDLDGHYSYPEVMAIVQLRFGKQHGFGKLLEEYSARHAGAACGQVVTAGKIQCWRRANAFPAWAVEQLKAMPVAARAPHRWTPQDVDFLVALHQADPTLPDARLASECSQRFGRLINENSIKSKFNVLRKEGRISSGRRRKAQQAYP